MVRKGVSAYITFVLVFNLALPSGFAQVVSPNYIGLPAAGTLVFQSQSHIPVIIEGITIHPENPLLFDFFVDTGDSDLRGEALTNETRKLIKYFLAALTVPEQDLWVNLSPYERERIVPQSFGFTEMGRDLLSQDYILKQLTASLLYPEKDLGKTFWNRIYEKIQAQYGTADIPVNTFNKVWIMPDKAVVYEHGDSAFVIQSRLKVMLEEDYLGLQKTINSREDKAASPEFSEDQLKVMKEVVREVIIPEIEKEVNEGKNFAPLRQIYHSMILALWYKTSLRESLLGQVYADKNKVTGIDVEDRTAKEKIYNQYLEAFQKGVYAYIKEDYDTKTQQLIPRKYFSGGFVPQIEKDGMPEELSTGMERVGDGAIARNPLLASRAFATAQPAGPEAIQIVVTTEVSETAGEDMSMLADVFTEGLAGRLEDVKAQNGKIAQGNLQFFGFFNGYSEALAEKETALEGLFLPDAEKLKLLNEFEDRYAREILGLSSINDLPVHLPEIQLRWLFSMYRDIGGWNDMVRIYETAKQANRRDFADKQAAFADYNLAINRLGHPDKVMELSWDFEENLEARGEAIIDEVIIGRATATRNLAFAALDLRQVIQQFKDSQHGQMQAPTDEKLEKVLSSYQRAFPTDYSIPELQEKDSRLRYMKKLSQSELANLASRGQKLLNAAFMEYFAAYQLDQSYYAGINVLRTLLYMGDVTAAREIARHVYWAASLANNQKSFWAQATLLEVALVRMQGDEDDKTALLKMLSVLLTQITEESEAQSLLEHFKRWQKMGRHPIPKTLNTVILILETYLQKTFLTAKPEIFFEDLLDKELKTASTLLLQGQSPNLDIQMIESILERRRNPKIKPETISEAIQSVIIDLGLFRRGMVLPNNVRHGGLIPDYIFNQADRAVARLIVNHEIKDDEFDPSGGKKMALKDIHDPQDAQQWISRYIEFLFGLKDNNGRSLEDLESPAHEEFDNFMKEFLDEISGLRKFPRHSPAMTGATSIISAAVIQKGDCRPTHALENLLLTEWDRSELAPLMKETLNKFADTRRVEKSKRDYSDYREGIIKIRNRGKREYGLIQFIIDGKMAGPEFYKFTMQEIPVDGKMKKIPVLSPASREAEDHTSLIEVIRYKTGEKKGQVKKIKFQDVWYSGEEFYIYNQREIGTEGLQKYLASREGGKSHGQILVSEGVKVYNPQTRKIEEEDLQLHISKYSYNRVINSPHRYDPYSLYLFGQRVNINVLTEEGQKKVLDLFFNLESRQQARKKMIEPVFEHRGKRLLAADGAERKTDEAMTAEVVSSPATETAVSAPERTGGIDLKSSSFNLQIKRDEHHVPLPVVQQPIRDINVTGFFPLIINVTPIHKLPMSMSLLNSVPAGARLKTSPETGSLEKKTRQFPPPPTKI